MIGSHSPDWIGRLGLGLVVLLAGAGCVSETTSTRSTISTARGPTTSPTAGTGDVDVVNLYVQPTALNWDRNPGADGLAVTVYLFRHDQAQAIPMPGGMLEFVLFEGQVHARELDKTKPFIKWQYNSVEARKFMMQNVVGVGYAFGLAWGRMKPTTPNVTLACRYIRPKGKVVGAMPVTLTVKPG